MMSATRTATSGTTRAPEVTPAPFGVLQRKCACGGSAGMTGNCEECENKKLRVQRYSATRVPPSRLIDSVAGSYLGASDPTRHSDRMLNSELRHNFGRVHVHAHASHMIQRKQAVSQPDDPHEKEADQIAEEVLRDSSGREKQAAGSSILMRPPVIQRAVADQTASSEQSGTTEAAETTEEGHRTSGGLIVEDDAAEVGPGQMRKTEFLDELKQAACAAADAELAAVGRNSQGCPYIERAFAHYRTMNSRQLERGLRRYAPQAAGASAARDYIPPVCERIRRGVRNWAQTGEITEVPEELAGQIPGLGVLGAIGSVFSGIAGAVSGIARGIGSAVSSIGSLLFKTRDGGARESVDPQAIQTQLGPGRSLESNVQNRMGLAFGYSFSHVRIHSDARASQLSGSLNARAFTIGRDIAFGAGEYRPGTPVGDALIAHELAHVVQQQSSRPSAAPVAVSEPRSALEHDADQATVGAMAQLWSDDPRTKKKLSPRPLQRSALQLQRCSPAQTPPPRAPQLPTGPVEEAGPVRPMTPSQDPTINTVTPFSVSDCGNASWPVKYELPAPAATSGWILQHVVLDRNILRANGTPAIPPAHDEYWEAFYPRVEQNGRQSGTRSYDDVYDSSTPERSTKGTTTWVGKVKFYEGTLPKNFERRNVPPAGTLPMTKERPTWWNDTGTDHNLTVEWDCTGATSTFKMRMQRGSQIDTLP